MMLIFLLCVNARFLPTYIEIYGKWIYVIFMYEQCEELREPTRKNTNFNTPSANKHLHKRFALLERLSPPKSTQYLAENYKNSLEIFKKIHKILYI